MNPITTTAMISRIKRHIHANAMVNQSGGPEGSSVVVNEEVGTTNGVGVTANGLPETGT